MVDQVAVAEAARAGLGWDLAAVIDSDDDRSASRFATRGRPGWTRLVSMLRTGEADAVILWSINRGSRELEEWSGFLNECRRRGVLIHVVSHEQTFDVRKRLDWKMLANDGIAAADESEEKSVAIRRGIQGSAMRGAPYPSVPTGYKRVYDGGTGKRIGWQPDPDYAPVVREIFERTARHEPVEAIRRDLTQREIGAPRGGSEWDQGTVRLIAVNPAYAGYLIAPDGTRVRGTWEPLVSQSVWNQVQAVMANRTGPRPGKSVHLLSHLAVCGECGNDATTNKQRGVMHYKCKRKGCFYVAEEWLDGWVTKIICARLARPDVHELYRPDDERAECLKNGIRHMTSQLDEWAGSDISAHAYAVREKKMLPAIDAARRELSALMIPPALTGILGSGDVRAVWDGYGIQARRAVIMAVTGVQVGRHMKDARTEDRITFTWRPVERPGRGQKRRDPGAF
jgi:DNA invertase Pin-like site-specific DNA recombinase